MTRAGEAQRSWPPFVLVCVRLKLVSEEASVRAREGRQTADAPKHVFFHEHLWNLAPPCVRPSPAADLQDVSPRTGDPLCLLPLLLGPVLVGAIASGVLETLPLKEKGTLCLLRLRSGTVVWASQGSIPGRHSTTFTSVSS